MTQSASNTSREMNGILRDYVNFLKEHKFGGGLWSLMAFFSFLIATNRVGTAFAFVAQMVSFGTHLLRKGMNFAGIEQGNEAEEIKAALKKSARWFWFGIFPAIILVPVIFLPAGVIFWKWFGIIAGLYIVIVHSAFALSLAALAGIWSKSLSVATSSATKVEVPRPTDLSAVKEWINYKKAMRESPDTPAANIRVYGIRFAQIGLMLGLLMPLFWSLGDFVHLMAPLISNSMGDGLALLTRMTAFMAILLLIWTVPMKNVRRGGVIYSTIIYLLVLGTPLLYMFGGHVTSILPMANSVWSDVNRDLAHNAYDLRIMENSLQNAEVIITDSGGVQYTHTVYTGLPKGDGYYGDVNGDGSFNTADLYYYAAFIGEKVQLIGSSPDSFDEPTDTVADSTALSSASQSTDSSLGSLDELMNGGADITAVNLNTYVEYEDGKSHGPPPMKPKQEWSSLMLVAKLALYQQLGDINGDQKINSDDLKTFSKYYRVLAADTYVVDNDISVTPLHRTWVLNESIGPHRQPVGDVNGDFVVNEIDSVYLHERIYNEGRPPVYVTDRDRIPAVASDNRTNADNGTDMFYGLPPLEQEEPEAETSGRVFNSHRTVLVRDTLAGAQDFFTATVEKVVFTPDKTILDVVWSNPRGSQERATVARRTRILCLGKVYYVDKVTGLDRQWNWIRSGEKGQQSARLYFPALPEGIKFFKIIVHDYWTHSFKRSLRV